MSRFGIIRIVAVVHAAITFSFLVINDAFRLDNLLLFPDLLLCALLLIGAAIPRRLSVPLLLAAFGPLQASSASRLRPMPYKVSQACPA